MKFILGLLKQKAVVQIVGILALSALIWYAGPLVAFAGRAPLVPEFNRLLTILALLIVWTVYVLFNQAVAKRKDQALIAELSAPQIDAGKAAIAQAQEEEVTDLRRKFEDALIKLKEGRSKGRRGTRHLYESPWYIIIGAPGSGKTTVGRCILRTVEPTSGTVEFMDESGQLVDFTALDKSALRQGRAYDFSI